MPENTTNKDRLKEITASIEDGIKDLFQSDKYKRYLSTMSRFHKYSVNNIMLIYMQKPDATLCAGFNKWKDQFSRNVMKGEKGIKIIAPTPFKKKIEQEKLDPDTKIPMRDADGKIIIEEKTVQIPMYKVVSVFDVAQTEGKPLPELAANLTGNVQNYEVFMEALRRSAPVPVAFEKMNGMDGYFSPDEQRIAIQEGMSEAQTVCASVHEIAHSKLHNYAKEKEQAAAGDETAAPVKHKSRETEEIEAESISFAVCAYYGIETGENSLGYIATWSADKELSALRKSLETINKTSSGLITDIDRNYAVIMKERGLDKAEPEQTAPATVQQPENEASTPYFEYKLHANPRSVSEKDSAFIQAYEHKNGQLYPADIIGFGAYSDFIPLVNSLNEAKVTPEEAVMRVRGLGEAEQAAPAAVHQSGYEQWSEPATPENAPERPDLPSDDVATYLPQEPPLGGGNIVDMKIEAYDPDTPLPRFPEDYPMPDPALTVEDMHSYGYTDGDMLPVSKERAQELMAQDVTIYGLKQGERFVRVSDPWEVNHYDGMLGINTEDWEEMWETLPPSALLSENEGHEESMPADFPAEPQPEIGVEKAPVVQENPADPAISVESMNAYGYTDTDMLPLSKERAVELFQRDVPVYMLYEDNTEAMAFDTDEIITFDGMLGVTAADWELAPADLKVQQQDMEQAFLSNPADCFAIYQLKPGEDTRYLRFESLAAVTAAGKTVEHENYEPVYTDSFTKFDGTRDRLENLFDRFNNDRPADFHGHSLSMSDIVALKQNGQVSYHYVDRSDFVPLPNFQKPENYLKNAEMAMEDDYGMIDGIINNGPKQPTVAELEQQAKSGQPISLMDLAAATHRERDAGRKEKRPSVLAQLKIYQDKEKSNAAPQRSAEREL